MTDVGDVHPHLLRVKDRDRVRVGAGVGVRVRARFSRRAMWWVGVNPYP